MKSKYILLCGVAALCTQVGAAADLPYKMIHTVTNDFSPGPVALSGDALYIPGLGTGGSLFKVNTNGGGYIRLKTFAGSPNDGSYPNAVIVDGATIYGTTIYGGKYAANSSGVGVVYKINTDGSGFLILHDFDGTNGSNPRGPLALSGSTLYGVTERGGSNNASANGTVFKMKTDGSGFEILKQFTGYESAFPQAGLIMSGSSLYGTTTYDYAGEVDAGTIFKINTDGSGYTVLKHLTSAEGRQPSLPLTLIGTTLYGSAGGGGAFNRGTIFKINTDGTGFAVLREFSGYPADGANPLDLIVSGSHFFGATLKGGDNDLGTIFTMNLDGSDYTPLWDFADWSHGYYPTLSAVSGLTVFGATYSANFPNRGEVFCLTVSPPVIEHISSDQTAEVGSSVRFTARAEAFPQPICEWRFNHSTSLGASATSALNLTNVQPAHSGVYAITVTNLFGAATSGPAMLNVIAPVARATVAAIRLDGENWDAFTLEHRDVLDASANWQPLNAVTQADAPQYYFDLTSPLVTQRFVRATALVPLSSLPMLSLSLVPAITITGTPGNSARLDYINAFGSTNAWVTLATVTLTNTAQLYFDISASGQPLRLYRVVPLP